MRMNLASTLSLVLLLIPALVIIAPESAKINPSEIKTTPNLDFESLSKIFGDMIPVVIETESELSSYHIAILKELGIAFSLGTPDISHVKNYYLVEGPPKALLELSKENWVVSINVQTRNDHLYSTRDVSIPEIGADDVWAALDDLDRNITGEDILIADLDSGIDWKHPDFWFADGGVYDWIDVLQNSVPSNGSDGVDLNGDLSIQPSEVLYYIDLDKDGTFNVTTEWAWIDNKTQDGVPQIGEPFFVVNDTNGNDHLDPGEKVVLLKTPKTRYIVEGDGTPSRNIQSWVRDVNLTISLHKDTDGHGTAVSGILLGGQLGFRKYVGVAPSAELMMIKVLGINYDWLTIEEGLTWAYNHGADVILIEVGSWTYHYLDGSSTTEGLIDTIVSEGIPVIAPSGNLGGKDKHALFRSTQNIPYQVDFDIPSFTPEIEDVYITVLSRNTTDFSTCNFSIIMNLVAWGGPTTNLRYLHPGNGYLNWYVEAPIVWGSRSVWIESFISTSTRSTQMLGIHIYATDSIGPIPLPVVSPNPPPFDKLNVTTPSNMTFHAYISDSSSSWSGGAVWKTDQSNNYEITWPSTADKALSVASYRTRNLVGAGTIGDIASFSSRGPRIDETQKQGIAAPGGYDIISDYSNESIWSNWFNAYGSLPFEARFGGLRLFSGTSASGPHVAGCAALILQVNSTAGADVASIITNTARSDSFTGSTPNPTWGYGKLNVSAAVFSQFPSAPDTVGPSIGTPNQTPSYVTSNDTVTIAVVASDPSGIDTVILSYSNGTTWFNLTMTWNGSFYIGVIPKLPVNTTVTYLILANDTLGNWNQTSDFGYFVNEPTTTTTTETTTTTTTTTTDTTTETTTTETTTTTTSATTTPTIITEPDYLLIAIYLTIFALLIVVACAFNKHQR